MKKFEDKYLVTENKSLSPKAGAAVTPQTLDFNKHIHPKVIDFTYNINKDKAILDE
jgi:hypothetical protein